MRATEVLISRWMEKEVATSVGSQKKQKNSRKTSISASLVTLKILTVWITNKLWTVLKELGIPDHLTCLLRNLNASQEATVRTRCGIMDWFQIGKGVHQDWILSPSLFNTYENIPLKEYCILYASAIKNNEILPFVTTWMKLQSYVEWNKSDEDKYYMI